MNIAADLQAINQELASMLHAPPAGLALGAEASLQDDLVLCGLLGGKDVGKSTLINALAGQAVSVVRSDVGPGTERPMAYVHRAAGDRIETRMKGINSLASIDITLHDADAIRNVVLIDLPDFDSEFHEHQRMVSDIAPLLDRILWVLTPRKIGDRAWVEMFRSVIKDAGNVHCVLNKVDELLADADPLVGSGSSPTTNGHAHRFWQDQCDWVARTVATAGCPQSKNHCFLVAAAFPQPDRFVDALAQRWDDPKWATYGAERAAVRQVADLAHHDLGRLRASVLGALSPEEAHKIKQANRDCEQRINSARVRAHFDVDRLIEQLTHACSSSYHQEILDEALEPGFSAKVAEVLRSRLRPSPELADTLLERRIEAWPLLRLIYWPLGWLSRSVARRVAVARWLDSQSDETTDVQPFDVEGRPLAARVHLLRTRLLGDFAVLDQRFGIEGQLPEATPLADRATAAARSLAPNLEKQLLTEIRRRDRRPSIIGRLMLWAVMLWFPLAQPILEGILPFVSDPGGLTLSQGMLTIVMALSAAHLLTSLAVVIGVYVLILAGMYTRALSAVRRHRSDNDGTSPLIEAVEEAITTHIVLPLLTPFQQRLERLTALQARLHKYD